MTKTLFREAAFIDRARFTPLERNLMGAPDKAIITAEDTDRYERINTLNVITRYRVAWDCKLETLEKHYDEINHLLVELDRLRAIEIGPDNWDEYYDSWASLGMLYDTFTSKIALGTIEALFSSNEVGHDSSVGPRDALGMAKAMYATRGEPPYGLMLALKLNVGRILRTPHYFDFVQKLRAEQSSINRIKLTQQQGQLLINNAILAAGVGVANFVQKMIYALVFPDAAAAEEASSNAD